MNTDSRLLEWVVGFGAMSIACRMLVGLSLAWLLSSVLMHHYRTEQANGMLMDT